MLSAMGYKQGQGLGIGQAGRAAPVPVQLRSGRHGLGVEENKKLRQQELEEQQRDRGTCFHKLTGCVALGSQLDHMKSKGKSVSAWSDSGSHVTSVEHSLLNASEPKHKNGR